ncbi:hypothetical protein ACFLQY_00280 [Verrucomicrobiota bacterium]
MHVTIEQLIPAVPGWWVVTDHSDEAPVAAFALTEWNGSREVVPMVPNSRGALRMAANVFPGRKIDLTYDPTRG